MALRGAEGVGARSSPIGHGEREHAQCRNTASATMVEFVLGLHIHYDLVHYVFSYLLYSLGDGAI